MGRRTPRAGARRSGGDDRGRRGRAAAPGCPARPAVLFGPVASDATAWRVLDRVDERRLATLRAARAAARARVWAAGGGPHLSRENVLDFDATITVAHSDKDGATPTWKRTFGFHPLLCYLDRPELSGGEALAGLLRPGRAGSNTAADHIAVLDLALAARPAPPRRPGRPAPAGARGQRRPPPRLPRRAARARYSVLGRVRRRRRRPRGHPRAARAGLAAGGGHRRNNPRRRLRGRDQRAGEPV